MVRNSNPLRERIIETAIDLIGRNTKKEVTLNELTKIIGTPAPVIYNSYKSIGEINEVARKKINEMIAEITNMKFPQSFPAHLLASTIAFNIAGFFEKTGFSTAMLIDEEETRLDFSPLRKKLENLFTSIQGLRYDPVLSVDLLLHQIAAHIEYSRKAKKTIPDDLVEIIFKTTLYK